MKYTLILITIAVLAFVLPFFLVQDMDAFYNTYGFSQENLLARPYVLVTSIFMHANIEHLLANVLVWLFFGLAVEKKLGARQMILIFFLGAVAGDFLSLIFYPAGTLSVGASAGIFALVGAGMLVAPLDLSFYPLVVPMPLAFLGILYAVYNTYAFVAGVDPGVSYIGHFGGLIIGLLFGFHETGLGKGMKIILITLGIMILIPLLFFLLF